MDEENSSLQGSPRYYESVDLVDAAHPQTILAYEMNGQPLPIAHGAPRQQGPRYTRDPAVARPSVYHQHCGLYGAGAEPVQGLPAGWRHRVSHGPGASERFSL
jgi:Oxidoreductase molybdopterin binding domain